LKSPFRDIIPYGIAQDMLLGFLRGDPPSLFTDDNDQFCFLFHAGGLGGKDDLIPGADHRGRWFEEHHRDFRDLSIMFRSVGSVVAGHANDFSGQGGGQKTDILQRELRLLALKSLERIALDGSYLFI
jgi:hypothetical protein